MNKIKAVTPKITASKVDGDIYYSIHYYDAERKAWVVGFTSSDYDTVAAWKDTALEDISDSVVGIRPIPKSASDDIRQSNKLVFLQAVGSCFAPAEERDPEALGTLTLPEDGNMTEVITDLFYAVQAFFNSATNGSEDPLDFLGILTRLVFQDKLLKEDNNNDDTERD